MKSKLGLFTACLGLAALLCTPVARADALDYSSTANALIQFDAGTITFSPSTNNLQLTDSGLLGEITGSFHIGSISGSTASVSGVGQFVVHSNTGDLTADLVWVDIGTIGTAGSMNIQGHANMSNIAYLGDDPTLVWLSSTGKAANALTFQFVPSVSLHSLATDQQGHTTSFSGSIAVVPDGGTMVMLLGIAFSGLALIRRRITA